MKVNIFSLLLLSCFTTWTLADAFSHKGQQVENYHFFSPKMKDEKRNQIQEGIDTRLPSLLRSTQGHYLHKKQVDVMMNLFGTEHTLKLTLNEDLIHPNYHVIYGPDTIDENGNTVRNIKYGTENCYYGGQVQGVKDSFLAVSTCNQKMEGVLKINGEYYSIEPKNSDEKRNSENEEDNTHVVFKSEDIMNMEPSACGVEDNRRPSFLQNEEENQVAEEMKSESTHQKRGSKYLELLAVNDFARVTALTAGKVEADTISIINSVTQIYATSGFALDGLVIITLMGQYVPSSEEWLPGNSSPDSAKLLEEFRKWRVSKLGKSSDALGTNDNAHLLSGRDFYSGSSAGNAGYAYVGSLCGDYSCGATEAWSDRSIAYTSYLVSHEIGHNFNSEHDGSGNSCEMNKNVMSPTICSTCSTFSSCSKNYIQNYVPKATCLDNTPSVPGNCGNYILDAGEQCDFGSNGTSCCNGASSSSPCTWKSGAQCDNSSPCCSGCKLRPTNYVCKSASNPCDLDDYCTSDGKCPTRFKFDADSCGTNSVCSSGTCVSRTTQCQSLNDYTFTFSNVEYKGPFTACKENQCDLNCLGTSTSSQTLCMSMSSFNFPKDQKFAAYGLSCQCAGGATGFCPGNSATCDCVSPKPTNSPTNAPTSAPTNRPTSVSPTIKPTSTPPTLNNSSNSIKFSSLLVIFPLFFALLNFI